MVQAASRSRRSSLDSPEDTSSPTSPVYSESYSSSGFDSSSALVLLPNDDDRDFSDFSDDEDQEEHDPHLEITKPPLPPLPAHTVFLYLLAPYLRVGAIFVAEGSIPLKFGLFILFLAATLSAFSRTVWFRLARYLRKSTAEDIFLEMIPKNFVRAKRKRREAIRCLLICVTGSSRVLTASMYLRASVDSVYPLVLNASPVKSRLITTLVISLLMSVVSLPKSLAAKPVVCATWLSTILYTAWLAAALYNHASGTPMPSPMWLQHGVLWNDTTSILFSFATSLTIPLSASLAGQASTPSKMGRGTYFPMLGLFSAALATILILPSVLMASDPNARGTLNITRDIPVHVLRASSLLFAIPSVLVCTPPLSVPLAVRRVCKFNLGKATLILVVVLLSLAPPSYVATLNDITLLLALAGTYFLPACAHIVIHYFRRPLSIVIPSHSVPNTPHDQHIFLPQPSPDLLLQRKEKLLQRKRLWRRILWDVGVWLLLIPISLFGMAWAGGRLVGKW